MAHRRPSTARASGDTTGATDPGTDEHGDGSLRATFLPLDCALVTVRVAGHRGGADENWADRYARQRPGHRHRAGHPWLPPPCADPGTGRVASGESQRRGSRVRAVLRRSRLAALRWPQRPAAVVPPTRSTASPPAGPDWLHHGPPPARPPGDGRGRAHKPDAAVSPNQCPQPNRKACNDRLAPDVWRSARQGPSLSLTSLARVSLYEDLP